MEAMIFMMIFGACLLIVPLSLFLSKDPRQSIFLARVRNLDSMSLEQAKDKAREIGKIVGIVGLVIIVLFGMGAALIQCFHTI